jgi:hypothetical protein
MPKDPDSQKGGSWDAVKDAAYCHICGALSVVKGIEFGGLRMDTGTEPWMLSRVEYHSWFFAVAEHSVHILRRERICKETKDNSGFFHVC